MGIGCPPSTAEYLKIYSDLVSVEAFTPVLSAAMGVLVEIRQVTMIVQTKKKIGKASIMPGIFLCGE